MSDAQRDAVQALKDIHREMKELNKNVTKLQHPSSRAIVMGIDDERVQGTIPVTFDWETTPIRGEARLIRSKHLGTRIELSFVPEDRQRAEALINDGFLEGMVVSSVVS